MKSAVIVFPGSNCDRDIAFTLTKVTGHKPEMIWHRDATLPDGLDLVAVPGGFSYGDYLRSGAMAANSPIISDLKKKAESGVLTLGICNGFQILTECGLLPGALIRNRGLKFICRDVNLSVEQPDSLFTSQYKKSQVIRIPVAHHDGNYLADEDTLQQIEDEGRVAFRYCDENGNATDEANPNGSARNIAGLLSSTKSVLGMMPHPERLADNRLGGQDGVPMFESLLERLS
ncbi:MAG: phosphoribosylformylglycinamidine synthase subunit PurQ [Rhodospirillales bacterium]|jgi:phosphoribosylformylglycinamidine synthase I